MPSGQALDAQFRCLDGGGQRVMTTVGKVDSAAVVRRRPVRAFPTYEGQRNYPGWLWTAMTGSLFGYESLLEVLLQQFWERFTSGDVAYAPAPFGLDPASPAYAAFRRTPGVSSVDLFHVAHCHLQRTGHARGLTWRSGPLLAALPASEPTTGPETAPPTEAADLETVDLEVTW